MKDTCRKLFWAGIPHERDTFDIRLLDKYITEGVLNEPYFIYFIFSGVEQILKR